MTQDKPLDAISPFQKEVRAILNRHSMENESNTPDFILAEYLQRCLDAGNYLVERREQWYGRERKNNNEKE